MTNVPALRFDHVALAVRSLARSRDFYVGLLGAKVVSKPSDTFVEILLGDLCLHLLPMAASAEGQTDAARLHHGALAVETLADLRALRDALNASPLVASYGPFVVQESPPQGAGGTHVERRAPVATLYFRDPDGIRLEARCYA
jgi:catechol 2,3-dioxygenase-like lactoylglutathione lyase family enzyme